MNKILQLLLSEIKEDIEIAKILLSRPENKKVKKQIDNIYRYTAVRNETHVMKEFLIDEKHSYFHAVRPVVSRTVKMEVNNGDCNCQEKDSGRYYEEGMEALNTIIKE